MKEAGEKGHDSTSSPLRHSATLEISANIMSQHIQPMKMAQKVDFFIRILIQPEFRDVLQTGFFC